MDLGILFGFIGTWVLIAWALLAGGRLDIYVDVPSVILVIGASVTVIFFAFPARNVKGFISVVKKAFFSQSPSIDKLIEDLVSYAEIARRDGILSLENTTKDIEDRFIVRGIQMAVDGTDPELIEQIMTTELDNLIERHETGFEADPDLERQGEFEFRSNGIFHQWNPSTVGALQQSVRSGSYEKYKEFAAMINDQNEQLQTLRGLLEFDSDRESVPIEEVEPVEDEQEDDEQQRLRDVLRDDARLHAEGSENEAEFRLEITSGCS